MHHSLRTEYDFVVVGAGSAGSTLAARLSERGHSVLVIEAGRHYGGIENYPEALKRVYSIGSSLPGNPNSWAFMGRLTPDLSYPVTRGRVVGGSSAVNGAEFLRSTAEDYEIWAAAGNTEWSYEKVLPSMIRAETDMDFGSEPLHGARGPIPVRRTPRSDLSSVSTAFLEACVRTGFAELEDVNGPTSSGIGILPHNSTGSLRQNVGVRYLVPVLDRTNLDLLDQTDVTSVVLDRLRAVGVRCVRHGEEFIVRANEVILCAGGIKSPQLLMLSGLGPAEHLRSHGVEVELDLPAVGQGLMDHPATSVLYRMGDDRPTSGRPVGEVNLNFATSSSEVGDNMRMMPFLYSKMDMLFGMRGMTLAERVRGAAAIARPVETLHGFKGMSRSAFYNDVRHRNDLFLWCGLDMPRSRGEIRLESKDPAIQPRINFNYLSDSDGRDLADMREALRLGAELLSGPEFRALGAVRTGPNDAELRDDRMLDGYVLGHLGTSYHTACTVKMGPESDPMAVVDQHCRVRGVTGLRVVDLSVLPQLVRRGPNATAVMLGERMSELMATE